MEKLALERSIWINAPRQRVWQAIADPAQMVQWFVPNLPGAQMVCTEDTFAMQLGPMSVDFVAVESVLDGQQLTIRSLPDRLIASTYMLKDENGGTGVTVRATGFELLNNAAQQDSLSLSSSGWEKALQNLNAFVAGTELPFPQAFVGPLFGYWRETRSTLAAERSIWINAPRERVWRAVTDPQQLKQWFSPGTPWALTALELGGRLYNPDPATGAEKYVQIIELLDPPHRLATRSVPEPPDTAVKGTTYTLKEENGGTRLTVTLSGYEHDPEDTRWGRLEQDAFGFGMMLQNVKAYVEGQPLPFPFGF
jgi:uncharacterized protein YndB with AHSA1/START domain